MRKLRICPARAASFFAFASLGEVPLFQRACNMELSADRSGFDPDCAGSGCVVSLLAALAGIRHIACTPSPSYTGVAASNLDHAAGDHVAFLVLSQVFVHAAGDQLLHA